MTVLPFPTHGTWVSDVRDGGRMVRVTPHPEAGLVVVSVWNGDRCTTTVRLDADGVAELLTGLSQGLAGLARGSSAAERRAEQPS